MNLKVVLRRDDESFCAGLTGAASSTWHPVGESTLLDSSLRSQ